MKNSFLDIRLPSLNVQFSSLDFELLTTHFIAVKLNQWKIMINDLRFASMHKLLPQNKRGLKLAKRNYEILQLNYGLVERPFSQCHIVVKFSYTVNVIEWSL